MTQDSFPGYFRSAHGGSSGFEPFDYQKRLALEPWPDILNVPTGMGKTAAVTLAWSWKRGWRTGGQRVQADGRTPRRLLWCLPMRVLVEQTADNVRGWLERLGIAGRAGEGKVSVHVLMGGSENVREPVWDDYPEEDMILIGTQDMLLSRALMRGYGMSRYQWPAHFALLHNDCLWVFDEVQLMGAGLATSAQLEAFRRIFPLSRHSRSIWLSATLNRDWLGTVDMRPHLDGLTRLEIGERDRQQAGERLTAIKALEKAPAALTKAADNKAGLNDYLDAFCQWVLENHDATAQTLVIVNRVERAQQLFRRLRTVREDKPDLLIHARFRAAERAAQTQALRAHARDRIIVATQAIEAGVDISSKTLMTELAPWASLVQRFGRCNRYGEHKGTGARILWIDIEKDADAKPYTAEDLARARVKLEKLRNASAGSLPATDEPRPLTAVLRRKDLLDLFNTDPDLSGFELDISDYLRDAGTPGVQVFWRDFADDPNAPEPQKSPAREELCPVSIGQAQSFAKNKDVSLWVWDALDRRWATLTKNRTPRPGMVLLARAADGGYGAETGFDPGLKKSPVPTLAPPLSDAAEAYPEDRRSRQNKPIFLADHLGHVARHADALCRAVGETEHANRIVRAARWHDVGKAHAVFQATMHACEQAPAGLLAKSPSQGRHGRPFFRHELASMLAWLAQHDGEIGADLVAYLILAHHGKVRMSLRAMPTEDPNDETLKRFARGIYEGDVLPALEFDGEHSGETVLKLALMEIGWGEQGPSWLERSLALLDRHGPFQLAWLETLVRLADGRASAQKQED